MSTVKATALQDLRVYADEDGPTNRGTGGWVRKDQVVDVGDELVNGCRQYGEAGWVKGGPQFLEIESVTPPPPPPIHTCPAGQHWDAVQNKCVPDEVIVPPPPAPAGSVQAVNVIGAMLITVYAAPDFSARVLGYLSALRPNPDGQISLVDRVVRDGVWWYRLAYAQEQSLVNGYVPTWGITG